MHVTDDKIFTNTMIVSIEHIFNRNLTASVVTRPRVSRTAYADIDVTIDSHDD